jgi:hypothetical protein
MILGLPFSVPSPISAALDHFTQYRKWMLDRDTVPLQLATTGKPAGKYGCRVVTRYSLPVKSEYIIAQLLVIAFVTKQAGHTAATGSFYC